jgi:hypothetical protein
LDEEGVPKEFMASRVREAALCFEIKIENRLATDETRIKHRFGKDDEQDNGDVGRNPPSPKSHGAHGGCAELCGKYYGFFRDFPRFYAQIRAVITRFYAFLRVRLIFRREFR